MCTTKWPLVVTSFKYGALTVGSNVGSQPQQTQINRRLVDVKIYGIFEDTCINTASLVQLLRLDELVCFYTISHKFITAIFFFVFWGGN